MSRPFKPTAIMEATGAFKRHPERRRTGEPVPRKGVGAAPERLSSDFAEVWDELVDNICPGVLGNSDRIHLELTATLLCQYRADPVNFSAAQYRNLMTMLARLGMNPSDRTRLSVMPETEEDPFDKYFS